MDACLCCQLLVNPKILGFLWLVAEVFKYPFKILKRITDLHRTAVTFIQHIDNECFNSCDSLETTSLRHFLIFISGAGKTQLKSDE